MTTDEGTAPTAPTTAPAPVHRASARDVTALADAERRLTGMDTEIDYEALAGLDDLPDDEAAALIDWTMRRLLST